MQAGVRVVLGPQRNHVCCFGGIDDVLDQGGKLGEGLSLLLDVLMAILNARFFHR